MNKRTPCKDCDRRQLGCHSKCDNYRLFREQLDLKKEDKDNYYKNHPRTSQKPRLIET